MALCALNDSPKRFLHMDEADIDLVCVRIKDPSLRLSLSFGIGLHHAGLVEGDRSAVEELFVNNKIQVLIATSTLAWGVNTPAHLVVVKGTEFFDAKTKSYVDFPITDVLQMVGRAGRSILDQEGVAKVLVQDSKKQFYKRFLHEPFPVESSLHLVLHDHLNAEIVGGTIVSRQDAVDYLTWTFFYRRLHMNPTYYGVESPTTEKINLFLSDLVRGVVGELIDANCVEDVANVLGPTVSGRIASYYYLSYKTVAMLSTRLADNYGAQEGDFVGMMQLLCDAPEYDELPVRHNEDILNKEWESLLKIKANQSFDEECFGGVSRFYTYDDAHLKAFFLLQAHLQRVTSFPVADYAMDTNSVLDQAVRILQAMIDVCASEGYLQATLGVMTLMQCIKQGIWPFESELLMLPRMTAEMAAKCRFDIASLKSMSDQRLRKTLAEDAVRVVMNLPSLRITCTIDGNNCVSEPVHLTRDTEYTIKIDAARLRQSSTPTKAYAPRFPKQQSEGWWVLLAESADNEIHLLKRVSPNTRGGVSTSLSFFTPELAGSYVYQLMCVSDVYVGLDVSIDIKVDIS